MLSLKTGIPIAKIINSETFKPKKDKHKYLGVILPEDINKNKKKSIKTNPYELLSDQYIEKKYKTKKYEKKQEFIEKELKNLEDKVDKEFILHDGQLQLIPNIQKERSIIYLSASSGAGKSTFCRNYCLEYLKIFPENNIFLISSVRDDKAYRKLVKKGLIQKIDLDMLMDILPSDDDENEMDLDIGDYENSLIIFDDIDTISNKRLYSKIANLRDKVLETGRHLDISALCTTHTLCNYHKTKTLINEAEKVILFPKHGSKYHIKRFCKEYMGFSQPEINKILDLPSRWVCLCKDYPNYVLYNSGCYLV